MFKFSVAAVFRLLFIGISLVLAVAGPARAADNLPAVTAFEVRQEQRALPIFASGSLASKQETRLSFKTGGLVAALLVEEGGTVLEGDVLARLDPAEVDASLAQAEARVDKAKRDLARYQQIYHSKVITLEQLQNARTELDLASAAREIARFNQQHSVIRAPGSGRVLRRLAEEGELVQAGEPVYLISSDQAGWILRVWLADRDVVRVRLGDRAEISLDALPDVILPGEVSEIAVAANGHAGLFELEVALLQAPQVLRSGFIARVRIEPGASEPLYYLPMESVVSADGRQAQIFVLDPDNARVTQRTVRIDHLVDGEIAVSAGLNSDERVVEKGAAYLREGMRVRLVEPV